MYEVYLINEDYTVIHSADISDVKLTKMGMTLEINAITVFSFSFLPNNPAYALMSLNKTRLRIVRMTDNKEIFEGIVNVYDGSIDTDNKTEISYSADDVIGVLRDSNQPKFSFKGKVSEFIKKLFENHNNQVEDWKQFELGICEVDTYRVYPDGDTPVNQELGLGDKATIKPTTKYIWNDAGTRLNIASSVLGVTHTVATVGSGTFAGKYRLRHPNTAWGISGWIQAEDIVEVYNINGESGVQTMSVSGGTTGRLESGTKVKIKDSVTLYYWDSYTTTRTFSIPDYIRASNQLTVGAWNNNRYALSNQGVGVAWIGENDILTGTQPINPPKSNQPGHIVKTRIIDVEVDHGSTWDVLMEHVIDSIGGEITRTKTEGIHTLNILNQIGIESDLPIELEYNIQEIEESIDATDIVTKVRAIGKPPTEDTETTAMKSVNTLASNLGTEVMPISYLGLGGV